MEPSQSSSIRSWLKPSSMEIWDIESAIQATRLSNQLKGLSSICKTITLLGSLLLVSSMAGVGFTATVLSPTTVLISITLIAIYCLGIYLHHLGQSHVRGLTAEQRQTMSLAKLTEAFYAIQISNIVESCQHLFDEWKSEVIRDERPIQINHLKDAFVGLKKSLLAVPRDMITNEQYEEALLKWEVELFRPTIASVTDKQLSDSFLNWKNELKMDIKKAVEKANGLQKLVTPLYSFNSHEQPRFLIHTELLDDNEIYFLLDHAYAYGIILELSQLFFYGKTSKKELNILSNVPLEFSSDCANAMVRGFKISLEFLTRRFLQANGHASQSKKSLNITFINEQLKALGFKWEDRKQIRALRPNLKLEDEKMVSIRGNCSELPNLKKAVQDLAPYTNFTIYGYGIRNLQFAEMDGEKIREFNLRNENEWIQYKIELETLAKEKGSNIHFEEKSLDDEKIWQNARPIDPSRIVNK